jgi:hypothetical protein
MKHHRPRIGEVIQFSLPDGNFAYGRQLRDSAVAFYRGVSSQPGHPPIGSRDFQFIVGVYLDVVRSADVPIVGYDPLDADEDGWPPAGVITDPITGAKRIYERGSMRPAVGDEWVGLETAAVWDRNHIVDRLMGDGEKWMRLAPNS